MYSGDEPMTTYKARFFELLEIYDVDLTKIRIGEKRDGGYIALEELCAKTNFLYSFGIGDDVKFELDFAERFPATKILLFDSTIDKLPETHPNFAFYRWGIGPEQPDLIYAEDSSILKMDVEWCEWDALINIPVDVLKQFEQVLVEFHIVHAVPQLYLTPYFEAFYRTIFDKYVNERLFRMYYAALRKLSDSFYIFHIHPNNSLPADACENHIFPPLLEVSFVRKDLVNAVPSTESFPVRGLDFPNKPDRPDVSLEGILK